VITSKQEKVLRKEIFSKVKKLYELRDKNKPFVPGKTKIPYAGRVYNSKEMIKLVDSSLDFWLTGGRYAQEFEKKFAEFIGTRYCSLTNSGSSANLLALSALTSEKLGAKKLQPGDEVITTACGFPTTLNPIFQNNLIPVIIDVDLKTYNIQIAQIKKAITPKTKAIFIAHTLGNPVEIDKILDIVRKHKLWLIEDNCDALGSKFKGRYTGNFGHLSTYSFYPAHHITMGEGGAVVTSDPLLRKIVLSFRDWGKDCWCEPGKDNTCGKRFKWQLGDLPQGYDHKYIFSHIGYNLKATDMQAAVGVAQLEKLPEFIKKRRENFESLYKFLERYKEYFILPEPTKNTQPSWFGFPILIKESAHFTRRDFVNYLEEHHIATRMLFGGDLTKQPAYANAKYRIAGSMTNTNKVMNQLFWIGVYPGINKKQISYIFKIFESFNYFNQ